MPYMEIYLARHGETQFNKERRIMGQMMVPLNDTGKEQAKKHALALKNKGITAIHSSDLTRATETSEIIANELGLTFEMHENLREHGVGKLEGGKWEPEFEKKTLEEFDKWMEKEGGEITEVFVKRVWKVFLEILEKHEKEDKILILSHGGTTRVILLKVLRTTLDIFSILELDNCSISKITYDKDADPYKFKVLLINDVTHLKPKPDS